MYSEHAVATLLYYAYDSYLTGEALDLVVGRVSVQVGRIIGIELGSEPSDASLAWFAAAYGTPAPQGTRAAVHVLPDGRVGFGLGPTRGVIETTGTHLTTVTHPEPGRYASVWRIPTIEYGGLI